MDYLAYYFNAMAYCGAVETLLDLEVPPRAQYLRVIHLELNRITSHLRVARRPARSTSARSRCSGTASATASMILDLFEMSSGQRMHTRYFQVGGVVEDIPAGFVDEGRASSPTQFPTRVDQFARPDRQEPDRARSACAASAPSTRRRCSASASPARCCARPATRGTCARPRPYSSYDHFDFKIPVGTVGDNYDRYRVRMAEMRESVQDHRAGARRPARGRRTSPTTASTRCRRGTSWRPRWRR